MILGIVLAALVAFYAAGWLWFAAREGAPSPFTPEDLAAPVGRGLPPGFLWGTATSGYQVEGGSEGEDWWAFEQGPGRIARGERSGRAADAWNRVAEDVELMRRLGANAYRFSITWSRVEPAPGRCDEAAWAHYADEVRRLSSSSSESQA